jgi:single-strand DNA-binding protein
MNNQNTITPTGVVATTPKHLTTSTGLAITSFRLGSTSRRYDQATQKWVEGTVNWFTVTGFRQLADNIATSINKGDRVIVAGTLRIRDWESGEKSGTNVDIEADAIGHDLTFGTTAYTRSHQSAPAQTGDATPEAEATPPASAPAEA